MTASAFEPNGEFALNSGVFGFDNKKERFVWETTMRFFTPSIPAGKIEYLVILLVTSAAQIYIVFSFLEFGVDTATREISYLTRNLEPAVLLYLVLAAIQWMNTLRRLSHIDKPWTVGVPTLIPGFGHAYSLLLASAPGARTTGYAPFGDNPYDPNSWIQEDDQAKRLGRGMSYQGKRVFLPGEGDNQDNKAA